MSGEKRTVEGLRNIKKTEEPKTFLIGCTHFGHANIIKLANRPFTDCAQMDAAMIQNWNSVVSEKDTVIHLGDFAYKGRKAEHYLEQLNGNIVRIRGNHDRHSWATESIYEFKHRDRLIVCCHYPIEEWNGWYNGAVHFHAHTHTQHFATGLRRASVGADAIGFTPISLDTAIAYALAGVSYPITGKRVKPCS